MVLFRFIVVELVIALNCRSLVHSILKALPRKWLLIALVWEVILVVVLIQIPSIRAAFGIDIPPAGDVGVILAFGLLVMLIIEATKALLRKNSGHTPATAGRPGTV